MRLGPLLAIAASAAAHRQPNENSSSSPSEISDKEAPLTERRISTKQDKSTRKEGLDSLLSESSNPETLPSESKVATKQDKREKKRNKEHQPLKNPLFMLAHEIEEVTKGDKHDKENSFDSSVTDIDVISPELTDQQDVALTTSTVEAESEPSIDSSDTDKEITILAAVDSQYFADQKDETDDKDCTKEMCRYELEPGYMLEYKINVPDDSTIDECSGCSITIRLTYDGTAWLGFAFTETGQMIGSEAVIGHPLMQNTVPGKYYLGGKFDGAIQPMEDAKQTLINGTISFENGQSVLEFEKLMKEEDEVEITTGINTFLWAHGEDNSMSTYHGSNRSRFQLNLLGLDASEPEEHEVASIEVTYQSPSNSPAMRVEQSEESGMMQTSPTETYSVDENEPALPCPPAYDPTHTKYVAGDKVEVDNYIWECRPYPYDMYCNIPLFKPSLKEENPDAEDLWLNAWSTTRAVCYKTESPIISPSAKPSLAPSVLILTALPTQSPLDSTDLPSLPSTEPIIPEADQGFPFAVPQLRFTEWMELGENEKATAESIGYNKYSWNNLEILDIEQMAFKDLSSSEQQGAMVLGLDEQTWDCFMVHYYSYTWSELEGADLSQYFDTLGWTQESWEGNGNPPLSNEMSWHELSLEEQKAATKICYSGNAWDWVPLPSW